MIENHNLDFLLALEQVRATKEELKKSLKRKKEMEIQQNETQYYEKSIEYLCDEGRSSETNVAIVDLLEKKNNQMKK